MKIFLLNPSFIKPIIKKISLLFLWVFVLSCEEDKGTVPLVFDGNLYQQLQQLEDYSLFTEALVLTGLDSELSSPQFFTVFAPNNVAFSRFLEENNAISIADLPFNLLEATVRYHLVLGDNPPTKLGNNLNVTTLLGATLSISVQAGNWQVNTIPFNFGANLLTINGTLYPVGQVIPLPEALKPEPPIPTIAEALASNSEYASFYELLIKGEQLNRLADTLTTQTLFVFNNEAFDNFIQQKGFANLNELPNYIAKNFASYHLVGQLLSHEDLNIAETLSSLFGKEIQVIKEGNTIRLKSPVQNNTLLLKESGIEVNNGVIYLIEFPLEVPITLQNFLAEETEFSWLKAALSETDIWQKLDDISLQSTLVAGRNEALTEYVTNQTAFNSADDFLNSTDAFSLATFHLIEEKDLITSEIKNVKTLSKKGELNRSVLLTPEGFINEQIQPTRTGKYEHYYVVNGSLYFTEELINYLTINDLLAIHPHTKTLNELVNQLNFGNSLNTQNITFIAPNNEAFQSAINTPNNGIDSLQQITANLLFYHLSEGLNTTESLGTGDVLNTFLSEQKLNISTTNGLVFFGNKSTSRAILSDFVTENGVFHLVDQVLLP